MYGALAFEMLVPVLFLIKPLRPLRLLWGFAFLFGITLTMYQLIFFTLQLLVMFVVFVDEGFLRRIKDWVLVKVLQWQT